MLDTNILIYFIKNKPPSIAEKINALEQGVTLCMSFFTYAELLKGAERSNRKTQVLRQLNQLTQVISVVQFTRLKEAGTPIGANDLWIACHALAQDATLVTHNIREFQRVSGLRLEDWVIE
jgi:tRNA(fMet)-specific endonuclease VapC